jgi:phage gp46-like protein
MAGPRPTFRWNVLAFLAVLAITVAASTVLLVLLDPRTQGWWGDRFSELGTAVHQLLLPFLGR